MKSSSVSRVHRTNAKQRSRILAAYKRSGLSGAAFARQEGIKYTTFCGWPGQQVKTSAAFVQLELLEPQPAAELVLELGSNARLRLTSPAQIALAARLLQTLHPS